MQIPAITEKDFRQMVVDLAKLCGWRVYFTWGSLHSPAGFPDLVLCRPSRLAFIELKSDKGKLTDAQWKWLNDLKACNVEVHVWKPSQWDEIVITLERQS